MRLTHGELPAGNRPRRHLVLVGGGHAHVHVLKSLAMDRPAAARVTLISPSPRAVYSGMVPGSLVGVYGDEEGWIDVAALAARAGIAFLPDRVLRLDPARSVVETEVRGEIPYDVLSLDVGSRPFGIPDKNEHRDLVGVKPVEEAAPRITRFLREARAGHVAPRAVVIGGGAGGVEVAFALRAELRELPGARVDIVEREEEILPSASPRVRRLVARLLAHYGVQAWTGVAVAELRDGEVALANGTNLAASLVVWASGAEGLPWLRDSGLPVDARGFLLVDACLRSIGAPAVFAAGDCARMQDHREMARAGVYAVRQGPILSRNVRAALAGTRLTPYRPQKRFLSLLSTGDRRAVLSYGGIAAHGRPWWWLKDWIDRRFIEKYSPPRTNHLRRGDAPTAGMEMAPCGGCAAKVEPRALEQVLSRLAVQDRDPVVIGLSSPDDAAVVRQSNGQHLVASVDAFPPFLSDLFSVGEIAAVNAASDVYAMGGVPSTAMLIGGVRAEDGRAAEADLFQLLAGARRGLDRMGIALVGGHSLSVEGSLIGFSVMGSVDPNEIMTKQGSRAGDLLIVTKPLGTAVILAATRAGECPAAWTDSALTSMRESNAEASRVLRETRVRTCTDVTGFGLLGHLYELLRASRVSAKLWLDRIPALPGALELLAHGWRSSADASLQRSWPEVRFASGIEGDDPRVALLRDAQTSGGLLAVVDPGAWPNLEIALERAGVHAFSIGVVADGPESIVTLHTAPPAQSSDATSVER